MKKKKKKKKKKNILPFATDKAFATSGWIVNTSHFARVIINFSLASLQLRTYFFF